MTLHRKDFDRSARIFKAALYLAQKGADPCGLLETMAEDFADLFAEQNPSFDKDKFYLACGFDLPLTPSKRT